MPRSFLRNILVVEAHEGGLMGHFGVAKNFDTLHEKFFWPQMRKSIEKHCKRCVVCKQAKAKNMPHGLFSYSYFSLDSHFYGFCARFAAIKEGKG